MTNLNEYQLTANANGQAPTFDVAPPGFPENMHQNLFNDSTRTFIAAVRTFYDDPEYLDITRGAALVRLGAAGLQITGVDLTAYYTVGRRIKTIGSSTIVSTVVSSVFSGGNTTVTTGNAGVPVSPTQSLVYFGASLRSAAFLNSSTAIGDIPVNVSPGGALGTGAYKNQSNTTGDLAVHSQTGPLTPAAYATIGNTIGNLAIHSATGPLAELAYRPVPGVNLANHITASQAISAATETIIDQLGNVTVPGTPDGTKWYKVSVVVNVTNDSASNNTGTVRVRMGTNGNLTDALVAEQTVDIESSSAGLFSLPNIPLTTNLEPPANAKITVSFQGTSAAHVPGHATERQSWLYIEQVLL
jgi:hypothetical protein